MTKIYRLKSKRSLAELRFPADCTRIQQLFWYKWKVFVTEQIAQEIWEDYSEDYAAGWLVLPETDRDLVAILERYVEEVPDEQE